MSSTTSSSTALLLHGILYERPAFTVAYAILIFSFIFFYYRGQARKLRHIPSIGLDIPMLSYFSTFRYLFSANKMLDEGFKRWPGALFKVPGLFEWSVVGTGPKFLEEIRKAPDNIISMTAAINETIQMEYTLGTNMRDNRYHAPIIRTTFTRILPILIPEVYDEVVHAFNDIIPATEEWQKVPVLDTMRNIVCRASNRVFVGLPLCRNTDYVDLNVKFAINVITTATILRLVPRVLRPLVNHLLSNVPNCVRRGVKHLEPVLHARRKIREEKGKNYPEKPVDILSLLMDEATGEEASDWNLTLRILAVNLASIHTTSMTFTHALFYLAEYQEYAKTLREEVEEVVRREGWSKSALEQMHKIDSFIKESQRLRSNGNVTRVVEQDYTFSNGVQVPKGTTIKVYVAAAHLDETVYEEPLKFDGFRFVKMKERQRQSEVKSDSSEKKFDIVTVDANSLNFGFGRHACPGRFFVANEMKLMLAHIVLTYDLKLETEGVHPPDVWMGGACIPNPKANVLFRKRM